MPAELLHQVHFSIPGQIEPVIDLNLNAFDLSNDKIAITFEPETVEDQEIINSWGGLDNTPGYLVRLRPVLLINGQRETVGKEGLPSETPLI